MAPRAPSKKRGNLRIDAAMDAMRPFGFPPTLVRSTVKDLLTVYGGDEGWVFIEEGSYTLLIDTLLEKQKDGTIDKDGPENGRIEYHAETSMAGCSSALNETASSNPEAEVKVKKSVVVEAFDTTLPTYISEHRCQKHYKDSGGDDRFWSSVNQSLAGAAPTIRRRKHYHGWICSDGEEDLVYLTPVPLPEEFVKLLNSHGQRKRKKRWDVKPDAI